VVSLNSQGRNLNCNELKLYQLNLKQIKENINRRKKFLDDYKTVEKQEEELNNKEIQLGM
jgi:hypothetical protein